mmetsp:Transcript_249/g.528  ORF Transcript_249/g.528 Transcript_249/m.528 type:complete len:108 (+) Transcript_249:1712-2035(+)
MVWRAEHGEAERRVVVVIVRLLTQGDSDRATAEAPALGRSEEGDAARFVAARGVPGQAVKSSEGLSSNGNGKTLGCSGMVTATAIVLLPSHCSAGRVPRRNTQGECN